jgi:hypothetical protein
MPVLTSIAPASVPAGAFAIAVNGSGFVGGAQVLLAGAPLATTFATCTLYATNAFGRATATVNVTVK